MSEHGNQGGSENVGSNDPMIPEEPQDFLTVSGHEQRARQSTIVFVALFAVGIGALFFMVKKSKPMAAVAAESQTEQAQIEAAITRLTGVSSEMMTHMDEIVAKFHDFETVEQVQVDELAKNPFSIDVSGQTLKIEDDRDGSQEIDPMVLLEQQVQSQAKHLELLSILREADDNRCMIDDTICRTGDIIKGFQIEHIGTNQVELQWVTDQMALSPDELNRLKVILKLTE